MHSLLFQIWSSIKYISGDNATNTYYLFDRCGWNIFRRYGILRIIFHMHSSDLKYFGKRQVTNSSTFSLYFTTYISIVKCSGLEFHWRKVDICSIFCSCFLVRTKTISLHQKFLFFQDVLLAAFGSLFFLSIGAKIIDIWRPVVMKNYGCFGNAQALGALSILTSFLYLGDACFNVITLRKE